MFKMGLSKLPCVSDVNQLKSFTTDQLSPVLQDEITAAEFKCSICKKIEIGCTYAALRPCSGEKNHVNVFGYLFYWS